MRVEMQMLKTYYEWHVIRQNEWQSTRIQQATYSLTLVCSEHERFHYRASGIVSQNAQLVGEKWYKSLYSKDVRSNRILSQRLQPNIRHMAELKLIHCY